MECFACLNYGQDIFYLVLSSCDSLCSPVVKFIVPDCGILVDSGIGSSYRLARLHRLGGPVRKPYAGVNIYPPIRDYEFGYHCASCCMLHTGIWGALDADAVYLYIEYATKSFVLPVLPPRLYTGVIG
jgi:hypothetical protein